jgi:Arc/MetJ family transcription regulator
MAAPSKSARSDARRSAAHEGKVRKAFWLDPQLLSEAQAALGTATERETVELALDLVAFRGELLAGAKALRGECIRRVFSSDHVEPYPDAS